jgi:hypothetical protein
VTLISVRCQFLFDFLSFEKIKESSEFKNYLLLVGRSASRAAVAGVVGGGGVEERRSGGGGGSGSGCDRVSCAGAGVEAVAGDIEI